MCLLCGCGGACLSVHQLLFKVTSVYVSYWNKNPQAKATGRGMLRLKGGARGRGGIQALELLDPATDEHINPQVNPKP